MFSDVGGDLGLVDCGVSRAMGFGEASAICLGSGGMTSANLRITFSLFWHFFVTYHFFGTPFCLSTLFYFFGYFSSDLSLT